MSAKIVKVTAVLVSHLSNHVREQRNPAEY